ncbi:MAG: type II toxin-antitoxin system VapC family toxin [Kofleriaceae bacterium]
MTRLLDTSVCIPLINRSEPSLAKRLLAADPSSIVLCSVVRAELAFGARNSSRVAENLDRVEQFCSAFESLPFADSAADAYGEIRARLRREGRPIGGNDLMIAAIAVASGLTLITRNVGEFKRVPKLATETW